MATERRVRLTKVDEVQFLTCVQRSVWGSERPRFRQWSAGDCLFFFVGHGIAGFARVVGTPFKSEERVWNHGLFPYRIPVDFIHVIRSDNRPLIRGAVHDALVSTVGKHFGWAILNQQVLPESVAKALFSAVRAKPNDLAEVLANMPAFVGQARLQESATPRRLPRYGTRRA